MCVRVCAKNIEIVRIFILHVVGVHFQSQFRENERRSDREYSFSSTIFQMEPKHMSFTKI